jgi:hypothetical protein
VGLQGVHAAGHPQAVEPIVALAGQYDVEGRGAQQRLGIGPPISLLNGAIRPIEDAADELVDGAVGVDNQ